MSSTRSVGREGDPIYPGGPELLVDGNNLLMRAIHASKGGQNPLMNDEGVWTAPVMIFIQMLAKYVRFVKPGVVMVAWDRGYTHRTAIYPDYKSNRAEIPDEDQEHREGAFALAKEFLALSGIYTCSREGLEADDVIAAHAVRAANFGYRAVVLSGDKDLLQLVGLGGGDITQIRPVGGTDPSDEVWNPERVRESMGCEPKHLPLVMALTGDSGDGIPGVPGFGTKTAVKVLAEANWDLSSLILDPPAKLAKAPGYDGIIGRNMALVNLRDTARVVPEPPAFRPTGPADALWVGLRGWCERLDLSLLQGRLNNNTLWVGNG